MHGTDMHDVKKEVKGYMIVFTSLLVLTVVTVAVNMLHLNLQAAITLALVIASIKASLVACYFMHLISERKLVYVLLGFTFFFLLAMLLLFMFGKHDILNGSFFR